MFEISWIGQSPEPEWIEVSCHDTLVSKMLQIMEMSGAEEENGHLVLIN